ncbi:hypothetical protein [Clostridium sp. 'White wine YQ']|uniref:hypothetical protein n=1 Tax=Clostridium sp. 'White wine YQ' TaxID=3027474 RepID=UPI0023656E33|nr:hypothetical protein [Clostridium sp. 'White wine YQ']MDD7794428.1 hypothetical protein [Clostridium sp. 'White wine YQ']
MLDLFKAFTTQDDFVYEGAFIAKVKYKQFSSNSDKEIYKNEVVKGNSKLCILNCNGYSNDEIAKTLTVYLMMNVKVKEENKKEVIQDVGTLWRTFLKEEIAEFSHRTGDTNSIHLTDNPVVQGLFILKELVSTTKAKEIEVKYISPVYGCNPVHLKHEGNVIKGFSDGKLCFEATIG